MRAYLWDWVKRHALAVQLLGTILVFDLALGFVSSCETSDKQEAAKCAEKSYGITQSFTYGAFSWFDDWVTHHEHSLVAASTVAIAIFTLTLWRSTKGLLKATNDSIRIANSEYISTHRPRFSVRKIRMRPVTVGKKLMIDYRIVNSGESAARILATNATIISIDDEAPPTPNYDEALTIRYAPTPEDELHSGQWIGDVASTTWEVTEYIDRKLGIGDLTVALIGFIRYSDESGIVREMAFGRYHKRSRFLRIDSEEYEYAD